MIKSHSVVAASADSAKESEDRHEREAARSSCQKKIQEVVAAERRRFEKKRKRRETRGKQSLPVRIISLLIEAYQNKTNIGLFLVPVTTSLTWAPLG